MERRPAAIAIRGAAENNLREVDLDLPHNRLVAVTGVSGSGKSSLVFDTLYAEARRRFLAALDSSVSASRQLRRPRVRSIEGLAPAIATDQGRAGGRNPRSTAATVAGIYDYIRLLFARVGEPKCLGCGALVHCQRFEELLEAAAGFGEGTRLAILAPLPPGDDDGAEIIDRVERTGYRRLRIGAETKPLEDIDPADLRAAAAHGTVEIVVDRLVVKGETSGRLKGSLEAAVEVGQGRVGVWDVDGGDPLRFSVRPSCSECGRAFKAVTPALFSFNSTHGACPKCRGLGTSRGFASDLLESGEPVIELLADLWRDFGHEDLSAKVQRFCERHHVDAERPAAAWSADARSLFWEGESGRGKFEGLRTWLQEALASAEDAELSWLEERAGDVPCAACQGARLNSEALAVTLQGHTIASFLALTIDEVDGTVAEMDFAGQSRVLTAPIFEQILSRSRILSNLGLGYLTMNRTADSLSSGEFQRLRLAGGLGSGLTQVMYLLDEPSAGLHARDAERLGRALRELADAGNTAIFVEHDPALIAIADYVVDVGPGPGTRGGRVLAATAPQELARGDSPTAKYLRGDRWRVAWPRRTPGTAGWLRVEGANGHNLKAVDVQLPLGAFTCVTGVSGSGKSTLVQDTLYPVLARILNKADRRPLAHSAVSGVERLQRVIAVDQRPIGRSSRSNAATYTSLLTELRRLFAETPEARVRGYGPSHFSFNAADGACPSCRGSGFADSGKAVYRDLRKSCPSCDGRRYNADILQIRFRGLSVADVLALTVDAALEEFEAIPDVARRLRLLSELGLGYLRLGQPASSLSGGEAQRVKLATELSRPHQERTLYLLDEPTVGLHHDDIGYLVDLLQQLVDRNNTVIVVEHCTELIATADFVVDLGPEAGAAGGAVVATGTPEQIAAEPASWTGRFLKQYLDENGSTSPRTGEPERGRA